MAYNTIAAPANKQPGLSDIFFCEKSAFLALQAAGAGTQTITTTHTFNGAEGFKKIPQDKLKHTGKGSTVGSRGSLTMKQEWEVFLPGIDEASLTMIRKMLNDEFITLHRDADCDNPQVYQLGDDCKSVDVTCDMSIGTQEPSGEKGYTLKFTYAGIPYIYEGVITLA